MPCCLAPCVLCLLGLAGTPVPHQELHICPVQCNIPFAGMLFLHGASPPVVHAGLKASNVLVDEHWTAKISDFDLG